MIPVLYPEEEEERTGSYGPSAYISLFRVPLISEMEFFYEMDEMELLFFVFFFYEMEPHKIYITNLYDIGRFFSLIIEEQLM